MQAHSSLSFPQKIACLTMDVEADHHDLVPERHYQALEHEATWQWLDDFSGSRNLPWTAFVVGKLLEDRPGLAERLIATGWELGLHAYSHDPQHADTLAQIQRGKAAFRAAFGHDPLGYRAPLGKITRAGQERLQAEGFHYDASIFPTWHPGKANHWRWPRQPYLVDGHLEDGSSFPLVEVPFAVLPGVRLIFSVSFVKLLGSSVYRPLLATLGLPQVAVIDCHFHDLAPAPAAYRRLPPFWKGVYARNRWRGKEMLAWIVDWLSQAGYIFQPVGEVVAQARRMAGHE